MKDTCISRPKPQRIELESHVHSRSYTCLFHRRSVTAYLYNGCLAWYNVLITSRVHSSVKSQFPKVRQTKYTAADLCDGGISMLNHCLPLSNFVNTYLSHSREWFNIHVLYTRSNYWVYHSVYWPARECSDMWIWRQMTSCYSMTRYLTSNMAMLWSHHTSQTPPTTRTCCPLTLHSHIGYVFSLICHFYCRRQARCTRQPCCDVT